MPSVLINFLLAAMLSPPGALDSHSAHHQDAAPRILLDQSPRAVEYQLNRLSNDELVRVERKDDDPKYRPVYFALLIRKGLPQTARAEALAALSRMDKASPAQVLLQTLSKIPIEDAQTGDTLLEMLLGQPQATLKSQRDLFEKTSAESSPLVRRAAYGAMMIADADPGPAWQAAVKQGHVVDLLASVPHLGTADDLPARLFQPVLAFLNDTKEPGARAVAIAALGSTRRDAATFARLADEVIQPSIGADAASRAAAIAALQRIPEAVWPRERVEPLARAIVAMVKDAAPEARTEPALIDAVQLGDKLVALLPEESRRNVRRDLRALGVQVVPIATVPEQLVFNLKWFAAEAGKPVQIVLSNPDAMQHNLVIGPPRSVQEIGAAAATMPPPTDPAVKAYVPDIPLVLFATRLLQGGETERLNFTAPEKPGEYVFLCTFPGHWIRMYGVMLVVPNLEAWEANPTKPTDPVTNKPYDSQKNGAK